MSEPKHARDLRAVVEYNPDCTRAQARKLLQEEPCELTPDQADNAVRIEIMAKCGVREKYKGGPLELIEPWPPSVQQPIEAIPKQPVERVTPKVSEQPPRAEAPVARIQVAAPEPPRAVRNGDSANLRILMTGFTTRMFNSANLKDKYMTSEPKLAQLLRELGHDVDHRKVTPGEDLSRYDVAVLGIHKIQSLGSTGADGTAWAFASIKRRILFCADWAIEETGFDLQNALDNWERVLGYRLKNHGTTADSGVHIKTMLQSIMTERLPLLATFFPWGDHDLIVNRVNSRTQKKNFPATKIFAWDPSPLYNEELRVRHGILADYQPPKDRKRQWVYAALQDEGDKWAERSYYFKWPVIWHRNKKTNNTRIPESDLLNEYAASWGILAPPYKADGSGWQRVRFNHAAALRMVMMCDGRDSRFMGEPYRLFAPDVEKMSDDQLRDLAEQQRTWFYANIGTKQDALDNVNRAIEVVCPSESRLELLASK